VTRDNELIRRGDVRRAIETARRAMVRGEKEGGWPAFMADAIDALPTVAPALHRSFPEAGDGRPLPPMGDELMTAGLNAEDARFFAVQLAQNGWTLTPSEVYGSPEPDPVVKPAPTLAETQALPEVVRALTAAAAALGYELRPLPDGDQ